MACILFGGFTGRIVVVLNACFYEAKVEAETHLILDVCILCEKVKTVCTCSRVCGGDAPKTPNSGGDTS
jgi:hypothetical protein